MKIALMQPYFVPYLGYFQLMGAVDLFVIHDDVEFSKGGWINRNRILISGEPKFLTIPLQRMSDYALINQREIASSYDCKKSIRALEAAYGKAPHWRSLAREVSEIVCPETRSLVDHNVGGLEVIKRMLNQTTPLVTSSEVLPDANSSGTRKVIDVCRVLGASEYVNPVGGINLYSPKEFLEQGIKLTFLQSRLSKYAQGHNQEFVPALSVLDSLAWVGTTETSFLVQSDYDIIEP